jgi:Holliday junction resolvase RusA-like endonuclease
MKVAFVIMGEPASKANSRQLVTFGRGKNARPAIIKSEKAREYEDAAQLQIPAAARVMLEGPVRVSIRIYYASERPDLDESVVLDVLQAKFTKADDGGDRNLIRAGVYRNDRQVREKHIFHAIDRVNPRAEIEVEQLAGAAASLFEPEHMPIPVVAPPPPKRARVCCTTARSTASRAFR